MNIIIKGKQFEITPRLRQIIDRKVQRLSRLVDDDTRVEVTVTEGQTRSAQDRYSVQLAVTVGSHPIRSEVSAVNANMALDQVLDKVVKQLGRQKDRQTTALRSRTPPIRVLSLSRAGQLSLVTEEEEGEQETELAPTGAQGARRSRASAAQRGQFSSASPAALGEERNEEIWSSVLEIRRQPTKPMNHQEVIAQMETLKLSFFPFYNEATDTINVMYRLEKGGYGLLLPELE